MVRGVGTCDFKADFWPKVRKSARLESSTGLGWFAGVKPRGGLTPPNPAKFIKMFKI